MNRMRKTGYATMLLCGWAVIGLGCAPLRFENVKSTNTLEQDHYDCTTQWDRSGQGIAYAMDPVKHSSYLIQARQDLIACMERKGWKRVE